LTDVAFNRGLGSHQRSVSHRSLYSALGVDNISPNPHTLGLALTSSAGWFVRTAPECRPLDRDAFPRPDRGVAHIPSSHPTTHYTRSLDSNYRDARRTGWPSASNTGHHSRVRRNRIVLVWNNSALRLATLEGDAKTQADETRPLHALSRKVHFEWSREEAQ
jgi:hypothetical protein